MMKRLLLLTMLIAAFCNDTKAQSDRGVVLINGSTGLLIDDTKNSLDERLLVSAEVNYFVADGVSLGGGLDYHTINSGKTFVAFGTRIYPANGAFFIRHRSMVNTQSRADNDFLLGAGYDFMLNDNFAIEVNGDYYFRQRALGLRFGMALFL